MFLLSVYVYLLGRVLRQRCFRHDPSGPRSVAPNDRSHDLARSGLALPTLDILPPRPLPPAEPFALRSMRVSTEISTKWGELQDCRILALRGNFGDSECCRRDGAAFAQPYPHRGGLNLTGLPMVFPAPDAGKILCKKCLILLRRTRRSCALSAVPPKADIRGRGWNVRFLPEADIALIVIQFH